VPGLSATSPRWTGRPALVAASAGRGLRAFHDAFDPASCPYSFLVSDRRERARAAGRAVSGDPTPPADRLVVCHGAARAANTRLDEDGAFTGHIGLGALGIADRWADLAVAAHSIGERFGGVWTGVFLEAYGVAGDPARTAFYLRAWDET
jgi:kanamycin kinase